jgi:hypothetical protein
MSRSIKDKIKAAKLPEKVVKLCLRGDLLAEHAKLTAEMVSARSVGEDSLAGPAGVDETIVERLEALRAEMEDDIIEVRLRAMSGRRWDELMKMHPARAGNEYDARLGYDARGFYEAAIRECTFDPKLDPGDWLALLGDEDNDGLLTDGQWDQLVEAVFELNKQAISIPFSFAAWLKTNNSASE